MTTKEQEIIDSLNPTTFQPVGGISNRKWYSSQDIEIALHTYRNHILDQLLEEGPYIDRELDEFGCGCEEGETCKSCRMYLYFVYKQKSLINKMKGE